MELKVLFYVFSKVCHVIGTLRANRDVSDFTPATVNSNYVNACRYLVTTSQCDSLISTLPLYTYDRKIVWLLVMNGCRGVLLFLNIQLCSSVLFVIVFL